MSNLFGTNPNQVPLNSMLGNLAFQDKAYVSVDKVGIGTTFVDSGTSGQILQVYGGGAYVSGNLGIGVLNPTSKVDISGNITVTNPNAAGLNVRSGASGSFTSFNIGRTGADGTFAVVATGGQFANDSVAGDVVIRTESSTAKLLFTNSATNSTLAIAGNNVLVGSATSTGTESQKLQVTGGAYVSGNLGIGTTNPTSKLTVSGGDIRVGINTSEGVILTSPNNTKYRLIVDDSGILSTVLVP